MTCPYRSVLYMPGSNARALDKARGLAADALILDLEDAVSPDRKAEARDLVSGAVATGGYGERRLLVRINGLDTPWGFDDLAAAVAMLPDAILVPKVAGPGDIAPVRAAIGEADIEIWAMMESPQGILNAAEIAAAEGMAGFVMGTNDLLKDIGARPRADRVSMLSALSTCVLAARAHGLICIDGVYNAFRDDEGLRAECDQGRDLGMVGKSLIHPAQIAVTNEVFTPSGDEIALAERQVAAFDAAQADGSGVAVLDGRIVENLHVAAARATLAKVAAIAQMEGA